MMIQNRVKHDIEPNSFVLEKTVRVSGKMKRWALLVVDRIYQCIRSMGELSSLSLMLHPTSITVPHFSSLSNRKNNQGVTCHLSSLSGQFAKNLLT